MAQAVKGFLTSDGSFYASIHEADRHEYANEIRGLCESHGPRPIEPQKFLSLIEAWAAPIRNYINANEACVQENHTQEDTSGTGGDKTYDPLGDAYVASVEQLTARGHEPVPHMGDSPQPEGVFKRGKKYGPRSRGDDA